MSWSDKLGATLELVAGVGALVVTAFVATTPLGWIIGGAIGLVAIGDALAEFF